MSQFIIYGLVDPRTLLARYIGLSASGLERPSRHRRPSELRRHGHKTNWIKALHALGLDYTIVVLEEVASRGALADLERFWIAYGRACGWPLTNLTDGGEGSKGLMPEVREQIANTLRGHKRTQESIEKQFATRKANGYKHSDKTRAKMRASNVGKSRPTLKGKPLTAECRAKISAAKIGKERPMLKGKPLSAEHRAKISAAAKSRHQDRYQ